MGHARTPYWGGATPHRLYGQPPPSPVDLPYSCRTHEDVTVYVQEKRALIIQEFYSTEQQYVEALQLLVEVSDLTSRYLTQKSSNDNRSFD